MADPLTEGCTGWVPSTSGLGTSRWIGGTAPEMTTAVLAVYGPSNTGKIERHVMPLAATTETTLVCIEGAEPFDGLTYRTVPSLGVRPVGLALMLVVALDEVLRHEYDAVVSFSLLPHGCVALAVGRLAGLPVHLGILGIDLDVHARAPYGGPVRFLLRRFDAVSVPGSHHRRQLEALGIPFERTAVLANAIDAGRFTPTEDRGKPYDFLWVGRFGEEKNPLLFVRALAVLHSRGLEFSAVMLGDGPLEPQVEHALRDHGIAGFVDRPGWVDEPLAYYRQSNVFVLTSRRDALPLTLLEAMATGVAAVVPQVGNVLDVAVDGQNAIVVDRPDPEKLAAALDRLHQDEALRERLVSNAVEVRDRYSFDAATEDWEAILRVMGVRVESRKRAATPRTPA